MRPTLNVLWLVLLLPAVVYGQAVSTVLPKKEIEEKKIPSDAVVLTPFEVSTDKDNGFAAAGSVMVTHNGISFGKKRT